MLALPTTRRLRAVANGLVIAVAIILLIASAIYLLPLLAVFFAVALLGHWAALWIFRLRYAIHGRDVLIVYSDSPNWQAYIEREWLPRWRDRAVVLNWSERRRWRWWKPEVMLFRTSVWRFECNPLAVVVPRLLGPRTTIPFWQAFKDAKHGRGHTLREAEQRLAAALAGRNVIRVPFLKAG